MEFIRTDSGIENRDPFYLPKILVFVEGKSDIPFYEEVLQNYNCHLKAQGGDKECEKVVLTLLEKNLPYVVILDGHYEILTRTRSKHRRVILLHRHSYENYLFEVEPIEQFCRDRARLTDSLEEVLSSRNFEEILEQIEHNFKELIVLDVAHQKAEMSYDVLPDTPYRFFKSQTGLNFLNSQIQQCRTEAANRIDDQNIDKARTLVEQFLKKHRFVDLLPGHFAFDIIWRLICNTLHKSIQKEEIRLYLSRGVWSLVNTQDHNSLKQRLHKAVREVQQMHQTSSSKTQPNTAT